MAGHKTKKNMKTKTIAVSQIEIPLDVMTEAAGILSENEIVNRIIAGDEEENTVTVEVQFDSRDKEEREAVEQLEELIDSYHGYGGEEEEENEEEEN